MKILELIKEKKNQNFNELQMKLNQSMIYVNQLIKNNNLIELELKDLNQEYLYQQELFTDLLHHLVNISDNLSGEKKLMKISKSSIKKALKKKKQKTQKEEDLDLENEIIKIKNMATFLFDQYKKK